METYLIFFGKSQDFNAVYFNTEKKVEDFDKVIKDFDFLESKIFTIDNVMNNEILSRYIFKNKEKKYSLLKLYSFAQAVNGSRVSGSIFGVGILSSENIKLSDSNIKLLKVAKDSFEKLSISNKKFTKSNFEEDVLKIWKAIVNNNNKNLLKTVEFENYPNDMKSNSIGVFSNFHDSLHSFTEIDKPFNNIYISSDLEHLKRTQLKWDKATFPIYLIDNFGLKEFKEKIPKQIKSGKVEFKANDSFLKFELEDLKQQHNELQSDLILQNQRFKKRELFYKSIIGVLLIVVLLLTIYPLIFGYKQKSTSENIKKRDAVIEVNTKKKDKKITQPLAKKYTLETKDDGVENDIEINSKDAEKK
ncbi:MAG: hypothetical protein ACPG6V_07855 [Flavobacteriales bacterium]